MKLSSSSSTTTTCCLASILVATTASLANAFTVLPSSTSSSSSSSVQTSSLRPTILFAEGDKKGGDPEMSQALPFAPRPKLLDGTLAGDVGFDPFGLAGDDKDSLVYKREAEIKHGRLAMLAAVGWPFAELFDKTIASALNLPVKLTDSGASPGGFNGGLDKIEPEYWLIVVALAGIAELDSNTTKEEKGKDYTPGDCGFDPLGLFPKDKAGQLAMQTKEIKHGRIAMMAVLGYAVQEALYRAPVTAETPFFFTPVWTWF